MQKTKDLLYNVLGYLSNVPESEGRNELQSVISQRLDEMERAIKKPVFIVEQIDRSIPEGRLLFAALIELGSLVYTNEDMSILIKRLHEVADRQERNERGDKQCMTKKFATAPFQTAINSFFEKKLNAESKKQSDIIVAGEAIIAAAIPSLSPDEYDQLERLLITLYSRHSK